MLLGAIVPPPPPCRIEATHNAAGSRAKPGHTGVTITEYACDDALKRILKLRSHRLEVFLVKDQYLSSLQRCDMKTKPFLEDLENIIASMCLRSLRLAWRQGLNPSDVGGGATIPKAFRHQLLTGISYKNEILADNKTDWGGGGIK